MGNYGSNAELEHDIPDVLEDELVTNKSPRSTFRGKENDSGFLVAKGRFNGATEKDRKVAEKQHVKSLANAIFMALSKHGDVSIRTIGARASYNATKSIAIATGTCATKGIDLCFTMSFDEGDLGDLRGSGHVESVTALKFKLRGYNDWWAESEGKRHGESE